MAREPVNLGAKLATFDEAFQPKIVGHFNDVKIMVARTRGDFVWHRHPDTDDFFLVLAGRLAIDLRDPDERTVELEPGELYVVPAGVEHRPRSAEGAEILLLERAGTPNTGDANAVPAPEVEI